MFKHGPTCYFGFWKKLNVSWKNIDLDDFRELSLNFLALPGAEFLVSRKPPQMPFFRVNFQMAPTWVLTQLQASISAP